MHLPSFLFLLVDDVGWGDVSYNNGTALTPNLDKWSSDSNSLRLMDMHSGGTVCSPSRASVLTGRVSQRDCVDYVYDASDPTEPPQPLMNFAPKSTFTVPSCSSTHSTFFAGKWHLGALRSDAPVPSSPSSHGFDFFNATQEVAPTRTMNCNCNQKWSERCEYGHYSVPNHCAGNGNPGGGPDGCCFNYWWNNASSIGGGGISNYTEFIEGEDSRYILDSFRTFLDGRETEETPFITQLSFHNCHIPYIGSEERRASCLNGTSCRALADGEEPYTDDELDYYSCISEMDQSVGMVLDLLKDRGLYDDTLIMFASDNGPEVNCENGRCGGSFERPEGTMDIDGFVNYASGSSGRLRGRKRDIWEGGHRVPGIISFPRMIKRNREVWDATVTTMDFLPTVMEILGVDRPENQREWALDGQSLVPLMMGEAVPERGIGWWYFTGIPTIENGYGYRYGKWKLVVGSQSCSDEECRRPQLFDLELDLGEWNDLAGTHPDILEAILANFTKFNASVANSRELESMCDE